MRFIRQSLMGLCLAALSLGLVFYAVHMVRGAMQARASSERPAPPVRERIFAVNVQLAEPGTHGPILQAFGEVRAQRSLEVRAASSGRIIEISDAFVEGGSVKAGDILIRIDPADAEAARARADADLADAEAEVRDAEAGLDLARDELVAARDQEQLRVKALTRQQDLETRGVGTASAVETAELNVSSARAAVLARRQSVTKAEARVAQSATKLTRAEIALAEAERRVADTVVAAPFDGALSDVSLTLGRLVSNNEKLATLIDPEALEVSFRLSTAQYARLLNSEGRLEALPVTVQLNVSGIDLTAKGRIARDSAAVGSGQSGRLVFATLEAAPGFKPGDFAVVKVQEPPLDEVVELPSAALDGSGTVLVLGPNDRLESVAVALVRRQENTVLLRGAEIAGREVVTARTPLLGAGIAVRPLRGPGAVKPEAPEMLVLSEERRAKLIAFVERNERMPAEVKTRILAQLAEPEVPAQMVERLESRMGS